MESLIVRTELDAPAARVWAHASRMEGVNEELGPWLRMSVPPEARGRALDEAPVGEVLFESWLLLFGALPFDRHAIRLAEVEPGHAFRERSSSILQRAWNHDRVVEPLGEDRCVITDRVSFEPRISLAAPVVRAMVSRLFRHRHAQLRARFGGA